MMIPINLCLANNFRPTNIDCKSISIINVSQNDSNPQVDAMSISPPLPDTGLPPGWTLEQWQYYGQQYLDMNNRE